jgi:hypothetical protein
LSLLSADVGC